MILCICIGFKEAANGFPTDVSVAKGCGFVVTAATTLVYITKLSPLCWFLPDSVGFICAYTSLHAHIGVIMFVFGMAHTIAWLTHTAVWQLFPVRTTACELVLLFIMLAMTMTATKRLNTPTDYFPFLQMHKLIYVYLPVLIAHVPKRLCGQNSVC